MTVAWSFQNLTDGKKNQCGQLPTLGSSPTHKRPWVQGPGIGNLYNRLKAPGQESLSRKGRNLVLLTQQKEEIRVRARLHLRPHLVPETLRTMRMSSQLSSAHLVEILNSINHFPTLRISNMAPGHCITKH